MRILLAPDSFKNSMRAGHIADILKKRLKKFFPQASLVLLPLSDGGEGFVEACCATNGTMHTAAVTGPTGTPVNALYGKIQKSVIIEMASAAGIELIPAEDLNPFKSSTFGVGQLLSHVIQVETFTSIYIGLGGSGTHDVGMGMLRALGVKFYGCKGEITKFRDVENIESISLTDQYYIIKDQNIICSTDVENPLLGEEGAATIYAPQKGANRQNVMELERLTTAFADTVETFLGTSYRHQKGAGAAGGTAFALLSFFRAALEPGFNVVKRFNDLDEKIGTFDVVITGEGMLDSQSFFGKAPVQLLRLAHTRGIPVIGVFGGVKEQRESFDKIISLTELAGNKDEALRHSERYMNEAAEVIASYIISL
jgi:glycerate 2-kinase